LKKGGWVTQCFHNFGEYLTVCPLKKVYTIEKIEGGPTLIVSQNFWGKGIYKIEWFGCFSKTASKFNISAYLRLIPD